MTIFISKKIKKDSGFVEYVVNDVLAGIEGITVRPMFGGYSIYKNGVIFALIVKGDKLYFKADEKTKADFEKFGSRQFVYRYPNSNRQIAMPYWELPAEIMEDKETIKEWVEKSYQAGLSLRDNKK